jgi:hypothetical protein
MTLTASLIADEFGGGWNPPRVPPDPLPVLPGPLRTEAGGRRKQ